MRRCSRAFAVAVAVVLVTGSCGGTSSGSSSGGGETRTVLVDYKHDQFNSAFIRYFPSKVTVRPGDTVTFKQAWSGEPHSVTMGKVVDDMFEVAPLVEQYDSPEAARAGGVDEATIAKAVGVFSKLPSMTAENSEVLQGGAKPCFVADYDKLPEFSPGGDRPDPSVRCPAGDEKQPRFTGRQALYNSGFIPYQGEKGNTYTVPVAEDATPGTYRFFCNYHWTMMSGTLEVVPKGKPIPSQADVSKQARKEIAAAAKDALAALRKAKAGNYGGAKPPLAGLTAGEGDNVAASVNEFFPATVSAKVGKPVTWTDQGWTHTVSFNVPKYFPIFSLAKNGDVKWDADSYNPVVWKAPPIPQGSGPDNPPPPRFIDVGEWNGSGGFHSSGMLVPGDTFTVTFTKPGTYLYACVLHPPMVGKVVVKP